MTRLRRRLAEAAAAVAALDEALPAVSRSAIERDSAILRFIYSYQAVWKASQRLLADRDNIEVGSPNDVIRAARRLGWLSDADAETAMEMGGDCNLAVQAYRREIGTEIKGRLPAHSTVLHRWLTALVEKAADIEEFMPSETYRLFEQAMQEGKQVICTYEGYARELCPIILGHSRGEEKALTYQFGGDGRSKLPVGGQWKCLWLFKVTNAQLRDGALHSGASHTAPQSCVDIVDLDVNPDSPYNPKRRLQDACTIELPGPRKRTPTRRSAKS